MFVTERKRHVVIQTSRQTSRQSWVKGYDCVFLNATSSQSANKLCLLVCHPSHLISSIHCKFCVSCIIYGNCLFMLQICWIGLFRSGLYGIYSISVRVFFFNAMLLHVDFLPRSFITRAAVEARAHAKRNGKGTNEMYCKFHTCWS